MVRKTGSIANNIMPLTHTDDHGSSISVPAQLIHMLRMDKHSVGIVCLTVLLEA
jgi:hypothetical protein